MAGHSLQIRLKEHNPRRKKHIKTNIVIPWMFHSHAIFETRNAVLAFERKMNHNKTRLFKVIETRKQYLGLSRKVKKMQEFCDRFNLSRISADQ